MIAVLVADLGDGYWTCEVRGQTLRAYVDLLRHLEPWFTPEVGDRALLVPSGVGWMILGLMGKGAPSATRLP